MRVTITGGTGFIGSRLALRCLAAGQEVTVLGQENTPAEAANRRLLEAQGARVLCGSVTDAARVAEAVRGAACVYHLAAAQHEAHAPQAHFWQVNVEGTRTVLEASLRAGVGRLVHGSTIGVYGSARQGALDETSPLQPDNVYGVTKLEGERLVLSYCDRLPVVVIRIAETYGPGDRRLLKLFKAIDKGVFCFFGKGDNLHHPIYIDDLLAGLRRAAEVAPACGEVFVLAGKEWLTTRQMVQCIADVLGKPVPRWHLPLWVGNAMAWLGESVMGRVGIKPVIHRRRLDFFKKSFVFSLQKANEVLGFFPQWDVKAGMQQTAQWYRERGEL
ncbi:MAG: epimerase [Candidatus Tectimicrobiota bacterium]|nr:MAG: epimerase [Candidatus Tectomicrobia bacterium]